MPQVFTRSSLVALAVATTVPGLAHAQDAAPPADTAAAAPQGGIQEIVVTAQKRAQNVQNVPIAISAFTASSLKERAVTSVASLSALAPNVNLDGGTPFSGSSAVLSATIRGIGSDDFAFNIDPGVGIYLDGVYLARTVGANQDLPDVERVEVLKGPQGTLFGRNTIGGAISIVTHEPGKEFKGSIDATTGSYNLVKVRGTVDVPLAPSLFSSVTFAVTNREGFLKRIPYPDQRASNSDTFLNFNHADYASSSREGGDNTASLRGKLKWDNGGAITATLTGDWTRQDSSSQASKLLAALNLPGPFAGTDNLPGTALSASGNTGFLFSGLYNFCIGSTAQQIAARNAQALCGARGTQFGRRLSPLASVNVDGDPTNDRLPWDSRFVTADPDTSYATGPSFNKLTTWGLGATVQAQVSDDLTIKSITAYRNTHWRAGLDADGSPLSFLELSFQQNQWQFSQEVQILGKALDKKLNYVLGGYYFKEKGSLHDYVTFDEGLVQVDGPNRFNTENYAFFGQVDYRPVEILGITVGGRYTHEAKQFEGGQQELNGFNYKLFGCSDANGNVTPNGPFPLAPVSCQNGIGYPNPANPVQVYAPGVNRKNFNNFSPKVGVQLYPAERVMVYGSWSKGYKTGGWTTRLTNPQGNVAPGFGPEKATTWEVGVKSTLLDRKLQLNLAAFTTDYEGVQLNIQIGTSPTIANAGRARIKGVEAEMVLAPVTGLTINGSVGYIDAHYTQIDPAALVNAGTIPGIQAGIYLGAPLPKAANWKINLSPRYQFNLANGGNVVALADWTHTTPVWNDIARTLLLRRPTNDMINASLTYNTPGDRWSLTVGGTNLTDTRYLVSGNTNLSAGAIFGSYNRPREWYLRAGFKF
ncbi:TonB-dependent receptor [Novosphingobium sp. AAP1]|uniref:TonB-dependent receptor n=1 Tax=Novosphingobium sp. AAP1 TaxID=1523413 RepID=UPI0009EB87E7|nr:TonB-dependent receptor [Novosphingobium sp. AAP1]